jgi:hypothetical protein
VEKREVIENLIADTPCEVVENFHNPNSTSSVAHLETKTLIKGIQNEVITNCDNPNSTTSVAYLEKIKLSPTLPKAFTEKGLYMLATILKSPQATQATITIVEAFAKLKALQNNIALLNTTEPEVLEPEVLESTGSLLNDLLFANFPATSAETSVELNLGVAKVKRLIKSDSSTSSATAFSQMQNDIDELKKMIEKMSAEIKNQKV